MQMRNCAPPGNRAGFLFGRLGMIGDSNFAQSAEKAYAQKRNAIAGNYGDEPTNAVATGLLAIADRVSDATIRIEQLVHRLDELAVGIHGPRPEAVGIPTQQSVSGVDSLSSRVSRLMSSVDSLQRSYDSLVR